MQFTRTLPRELVHRAALAEVFLTDAERHGEDDFLLAAQLPRRHAFYHDTLGDRARHDPMLLLEACRQGIYVVAHRYLDVPLGHKFLLRSVEFEVSDPEALACGDHPTQAVVATRVEHRFRNRSGPTGLRLRYAMTIGGREALHARIDYSWMSPSAWTRMRAGQRGALGLPETPVALSGRRVQAARVGRRDPDNAVITAPRTDPDGTRTARLIPDTGHPTLYDHWVDHVPGMLELEALRQLALTAAVDAGTLPAPTALPVGLTARFRCFAETDLPLECRTGPVLPGADIECSLHQSGNLAAEVRLRLADPATTGALAAPAAHSAV
ncbi:ScbA/BarX family gamma-butyrolactone biosynthesis protein [Streptomyces sp. GXMU-J15]|uniref:ScbA/BarX family gamma-butyrolactone biosynthesis protein n=1 Tax=Streptomyces fuscus TaxID=3048495 RepID=A0ABT7J4M2_9ACTN|nr:MULTISPECIES: ScbA/BarX family gamma-butyrolactone biosynthesis protein [Streptomyces]MDL2079803.1 ScbA/BarX family gamma-butyrolactone biosynthesis protein [Streptomyces fuscus]SBT91743.1 A-factor biosynthesis hotdog domain-containing protein [Streptomyces sp. DI166]